MLLYHLVSTIDLTIRPLMSEPQFVEVQQQAWIQEPELVIHALSDPIPVLRALVWNYLDQDHRLHLPAAKNCLFLV